MDVFGVVLVSAAGVWAFGRLVREALAEVWFALSTPSDEPWVRRFRLAAAPPRPVLSAEPGPLVVDGEVVSVRTH